MKEKDQSSGTVVKADVENVVKRLVDSMPELEDLTSEQLQAVAKAVVIDGLKDDLKRRADLARIDYASERTKFIQRAGRSNSEHTRRAYDKSLTRLEVWVARRGIQVICMGYADADDYAVEISVNRSAAAARRDIDIASAFFTYLERQHSSVKNPFRGTRARPPKKALKPLDVPTKADIEIILAAAEPALRAAIAVMAYRGLRVGGLPALTIHGGKFTTTTKGHEQKGGMPQICTEAIRASGLPARKPFADMTAVILADRFRYLIRRLKKAGLISVGYSVHDLRHYFAVTEYKTNKDIHRLKVLLNHASIVTTEIYLKSLNVDEDKEIFSQFDNFEMLRSIDG